MADEKKSGPNEEELEELEEEIEHARRDAKDVEHGSFFEGDAYTVHDTAEEPAKDPSDAGDESE